jgi:hypothetical protein
MDPGTGEDRMVQQMTLTYGTWASTVILQLIRTVNNAYTITIITHNNLAKRFDLSDHHLGTIHSFWRYCCYGLIINTGQWLVSGIRVVPTVACRPVARKRPRNKQLYRDRYQAAAGKQQHRNGVFCAVSADML